MQSICSYKKPGQKVCDCDQNDQDQASKTKREKGLDDARLRTKNSEDGDLSMGNTANVMISEDENEERVSANGNCCS